MFADHPDIANELFIHLVLHAKQQPVYIDIPECNSDALKLVNGYQMTKVFATARMYLREQPNILLKNIYGITSFELG